MKLKLEIATSGQDVQVNLVFPKALSKKGRHACVWFGKAVRNVTLATLFLWPTQCTSVHFSNSNVATQQQK